MEVKVALRNLRTAPRKVRLVADLVRGKDALEAVSLLSFTVKKSSEPILKLLNSALAAAKNDLKLEEGNLFISEIRVDEGPKLKRWHPMSRGRAYPIMKRTSNVILMLSERNKSEVKKQEKKLESKPKKAKTSKIAKKK